MRAPQTAECVVTLAPFERHSTTVKLATAKGWPKCSNLLRSWKIVMEVRLEAEPVGHRAAGMAMAHAGELVGLPTAGRE